MSNGSGSLSNGNASMARSQNGARGQDMNSKLGLRLPMLKSIMVPEQQKTETGKVLGGTKANLHNGNEDQLQLVTGEDAIAFFARHGNNTHVKFVYCNRPEANDEFRPYDMVIVDRKKVKPEYFTISAAGVVHIQPNEPSESITLADWMHQSTLFNVLRSIRFFKHYLIAKMFRLWRSNVRYQLYVKQRKQLSRKLFLARPSFCPSLVEVKKLMFDMEQIEVANIRQGSHAGLQALEPDEFESEQQNQRNEATKLFEKTMLKLEKVVETVCKGIKERARAYGHGIASDDLSNSRFAEHLLGGNGRTKSMVSVKKERAERVRKLKHAALEAELLSDFIRLIDYMQVEHLVRIILSTTSKFLVNLQTRKAALYITKVNFQQDATLAFSPDVNNIHRLIDTMVDGMLTTVDTVERINSNPKLIPFVGNLQMEGPKVSGIVKADDSFAHMKGHVADKVNLDFDQVMTEMKKMNKYKDIFEFGKSWDCDSYAKHKPSVEKIQEDMELQVKNNRNIEMGIRNNYDAGIFQAGTKGLKESLLPITEKALSDMKNMLLRMFHDQCIVLKDRYTEKIDSLKADPENLENYAKHTELMRAIKRQGEALGVEAVSVEHMHSLLSTHNVEIGAADSIAFEELQTSVANFAAQITSTEQLMESKLSDMLGKVYKRIAKLTSEISNHAALLQQGVFVDETKSPKFVVEQLNQVKQEIDAISAAANQIQDYQRLFDSEPHVFSTLPECMEVWNSKFEFWNTYLEWETKLKTWEKQYLFSFNDKKTSSKSEPLDVEVMAKEVQQFFMTAHKMNKKANNSAMTAKFKREVEEEKSHMPVLLDLGNKAYTEEHWTEVRAKICRGAGANKSVITYMLLKKNAFWEYEQFVNEVTERAVGEHGLRASLKKIEEGWDVQEVIVGDYARAKDCYILGDVEELMALLEDNQAQLQTMLGSRYITKLQKDVEDWDKRLARLSDIIEEWLTCQRNWMYLEPIFTAADIQRQLPKEAKMFQEVDRFYKDLLKKVHNEPKVKFVLSVPNILNSFVKYNKELDTVQKQLEEYLETKRGAFPRFYFLSNDELLQILSQSRDPQAVQPHLMKCFDNIKRIIFTNVPNSVEVTHMVSGDGEIVQFSSPVFTTGNTENWLSELESMMRSTVKALNYKTLQDYPQDATNRDDWLKTHPAQPCTTVDQIMWTAGCTKGLQQVESGENPNGVVDFLNFSKKQIGTMVDLVRGDLSKGLRNLMSALIILDVHGRDVVNTMVENKCSSLSDYEWVKQLRYYWENHWKGEGDPPGATLDEKCAYPVVPEHEHCVVRQTNAFKKYGNEYLGCPSRLVITPLTDKCILTLTGALHLFYGGAPAGPAGTGKTETVKDLAKALAIQIVVFNCSDGLNAKMMGRFFSGLAQAGAWACYDEFNRIDIEVLSVIAQQILTVQQAIIYAKSPFEFEGRMIPLNTNFGVFITMNPGYAGRTELPDNLKALFRPVAMMVPDYGLIAQIILFSEGFQTASVLSTKMSQLYKLASEQLSKQDHYDFGMRAVKSVLVMAGSLKRQNQNLSEDVVLIRAMRDSNVPKFLEHDLPLFRGIISDLFPGVEVPFVDYGNLQIQIEKELDKRNLQKAPPFITKIIQLHETTIVRHGVMLVGQTTTGKTTNSDILAAALTEMKAQGVTATCVEKIEQYRLNPKAVTMGELYGYVNPVSAEWTEGLVALLVREACEDQSSARKWIIFDGPVDALWIENMNTVLDDNKVLCLANGERIKLPNTISMLFEVADLAVASPATVSRCGMVFLELVHVGWRSHIDTWKVTVGKDILVDATDFVIETAKTHIETFLEFVKEKCSQKIESVENNLVSSCMNMFHALVLEKADFAQMEPTARLEIVKKYLFLSMVWSFGANIFDTNVTGFSDFARRTLAEMVPSLPEGSVFSFNVNNASGQFIPWKSLVKDFKYDPKKSYFSILVPTEDTTRYGFLLDLMVRNNRNVLLMGDTGVGKTVVIQDFMARESQGDDAKIFPISVMFSAQTTSQNLQDNFETKLDKKRKNLLGAPVGKKVVFFVDDLNMPLREEYFAQPPLELLRQALAGGFYDRKKLFFKKIKDVVFLAACGAPGGGRNEMTPRVVRWYHMIWQPQLAESSMAKIFTSILGGFLSVSAQHLGIDVLNLASKFVSATVDMYNNIRATMLPTPSKSHYTFNLRDMSKVVQGITSIMSKNIADVQQLCRLWSHEASRVFRDRLIDNTDRKQFDNMISEKLSTSFSYDFLPSDDLLFGDYMTQEDKMYREITDPPLLLEKLNEYLYEYNLSSANQMALVFFRDAIAHLSRVSRILRQPRGNALLVGVGGSGRQSLTRLASSMAGYKCVSIEITRGYGIDNFHESIKELFMTAGASNQPVVFLFTDTQVVHESFLEDINNILNSGEVPNLFVPDELDQVIQKVRPLCEKAGIVASRDNILAYFVSLCRDNLHIVLAFSPVGDAFRSRCRQYPSLVNCCTIDWFMPWPDDALYSVAERFLSGDGMDALKDLLCRICVKIHSSVHAISERFHSELRRHNYVTPTSYLELIKLYTTMLGQQKEMVNTRLSRYTVGLQKLQETNKLVEDLRSQLVAAQPELKRSSEETAALMIDLEKDEKEAKETATICHKDADECAETTRQVMEIKADCQRGLDEALPAFESSVKALNTLDKDSITMVKSYKNPPALIKLVMEAVCLLFDVKPSWDESKKLLNNTKFLENCKEFDKDSISKKTVKALQKYVTDPGFTPEKMQSVSAAAVSLCMWVKAMDVYARVAKEVAPKRAALQDAEQNLMKTQQVLAGKQMSLRAVEARVAQLQAKFQASVAKRDKIQADMAQTKARLGRAQILVDGLGSEEKRWKETADQLKADLVNLVGNMALSAGCISYMGPFTADFREALQREWNKFTMSVNVPVDEKFDFIRVLADPIEVRQWSLMGLPADTHSVQNGILVSRGRRWPLMIDPQNQANRWIKNFGKKDSLQVIKLTEPTYLRVLENAIRYGQPVLLENVEDRLDAAIEPVLLKQVFKRGGLWLLKLGDQDVPYSQEFKFYITTKMPNPHYLPEVFVKVTIINFTVTLKGLEDQLLVAVCGLERPDLEEKNDVLIVQIADDKAELAQLEATILRMLSEATGNILDDEDLIQALADSKKTSAAVSQRMIEAEQIVATINSVREEYRVVARRGSILYFVVADLAKVDPMYQYSLLYYTNLYKARISESPKNDDLKIRLQTLLDDLVLSIYNNICQGLFETHKLLFGYLIAVNIERGAGRITDEEWSFYVRGPTSTAKTTEPNPQPKWLADDTWQIATKMLDSMIGIANELKDESKAKVWEAYASSFTNATPAGSELPGEWQTKLSDFQKLLVLQVFRKDKMVAGVKRFVTVSVGPDFIRPPPFDLGKVYLQSTANTPIVFVLSPGADPMAYLMKLASEKGKLTDEHFRYISLGQGQGPIAKELMISARQSGGWVCLQNCHLSISWLPTLEQFLEKSDADEVHPEYRLWLTSMPTDKFPVPILQNAVKVTNEPPKGLCNNLTRTFLDIEEKDYEDCKQIVPFKKLLFGLAFFHAVLLERRKFGPMGWNIPYEWMNSDLEVSKKQLKMYLDEQPNVPWTTLKEIVGEVNYAGRVTDDKDQRIVKSLLAKYFNKGILDDDYRFTESGDFYAPEIGSLADVREFVKNLPEENPATFGLHDNADITLNLKETRDFIDTLVTMQPRASSGGAGKSPEALAMELAKEFESKLPEVLDRKKAHPSSFKDIATTNTLGVFLGQEMSRFNVLLRTLKNSLTDLQKAIQGLVVMSAELEAMFRCFMFNLVPKSWESAGYPSLQPLASWFDDFLRRIEFIRDWIENGQPQSFWLSGFFFPQGFMTGVLQKYARRTQIPIDTLKIQAQVCNFYRDSPDAKEPDKGVLIYGLFVQGAGWDLEKIELVESKKGELFLEMPCIWLKPVPVTDPPLAGVYPCPLYKTSTRAGTLSTTGHSTNFVLFLDLPSKKDADHWVRRGCALLTMLDD